MPAEQSRHGVASPSLFHVYAIASILRTFLYSPALWVGLLGLAVRLAYVYEIGDTPLFTTPVVDAKTYVDDALYLSQQSWLGRPAPFWQPPLYAYFLAGIFALAGEGYILPRLLQAALGAGICSLIYLIGCRLFAPRIAVGAALVAVGYGPLIYFGGELLPTIPAIFLNMLCLLVLLGAQPGQWVRWLASGALVGVAALAVANILLFMPLLLWWQWRGIKQGLWDRGHGYCQAGLVLAGCALVLLPVGLRNYLVGGDWVLISHNAGINFYIGNNAQYERTVAIRPGQEWAELVEMPEQEAGIERPSAKSRYFFRRAIQDILDAPLDYLALMGRKTYQFWHGDEPMRNLDPYYARHDSHLLAWSLWKRGLAFPFGLVAPLALIGLVAFWRSLPGQSPQGRLVLYFVLGYGASVVLFFVTSRYRLPMVPLLLLFAGAGLAYVWRSGWERRLALVPMLLAANIGAGAMAMDGSAQQHFWLGYAYEQQGMRASAERAYRTALQRDPQYADALLYLAASRLERQDAAAAIALYIRYLGYYPQDHKVRFLLANIYLGERRYDEAVALYRQIAADRSDWAGLYGRMGYANLMAGKPRQAVAAYRQTLALKPDTLVVRYQLARLYQAEGQLDSALCEFDTLLVATPLQAEYHFRKADLLVDMAAVGKPSMRLTRTAATDQAEQHYRRALALQDDLVHPHWGLGMLLARLGRYVEAVAHFERILELAPRDYHAHLFLGHLLQRLGRADQAEERFKRYITDQRKYRVERQALQELEGQVEKLFGGQ